MLWVFAESADLARRWLAVHAPGERAQVWSGGEAARLAGTRFASGDTVVMLGDIGAPARAVLWRCLGRSPADVSVVSRL